MCSSQDLPCLLYTSTTAGGISVGSLFLAGYIPGALLAVTLMIGSYIISVKRNYPKGEKFSIDVYKRQASMNIWTPGRAPIPIGEP